MMVRLSRTGNMTEKVGGKLLSKTSGFMNEMFWLSFLSEASALRKELLSLISI